MYNVYILCALSDWSRCNRIYLICECSALHCLALLCAAIHVITVKSKNNERTIFWFHWVRLNNSNSEPLVAVVHHQNRLFWLIWNEIYCSEFFTMYRLRKWSVLCEIKTPLVNWIYVQCIHAKQCTHYDSFDDFIMKFKKNLTICSKHFEFKWDWAKWQAVYKLKINKTLHGHKVKNRLEVTIGSDRMDCVYFFRAIFNFLWLAYFPCREIPSASFRL